MVGRRLREPEIRVAPSVPFRNEVAASMSVDADLADRVREELAEGRTPLTISADCLSCLGTLAGLVAGTADSSLERVGIVWLDAHGDFNTAASSPTGYLDGMALAAAVGREWSTVAAPVPGFRPVDPSDVIHVGGRDFDPGEARRLEEAGVLLIRPSELKSGTGRLGRALHSLAGRVGAVYLHVDLDVIDPSEGIANAYAAPGGLSVAEVTAAVRACLARLPIRAVALTAYDPDFDPAGNVATVAAGLVEVLAAAASTSAEAVVQFVGSFGSSRSLERACSGDPRQLARARPGDDPPAALRAPTVVLAGRFEHEAARTPGHGALDPLEAREDGRPIGSVAEHPLDRADAFDCAAEALRAGHSGQFELPRRFED